MHTRRFPWAFAAVTAVTLLLLALSFPAVAQEATGRIVGTVYDQSGAVVPDVRIIVTSSGTHISHETTTDKTGFYQVLSLPIGDYTVSAEHKGFKSVTT